MQVSGQRRDAETGPVMFAQVNGYVAWRGGAVCKTVGSAYVGSNPTPATTCENGPLAAETRPGGPFPSCHAMYQLASLWVDAWQCARTYGVQRPGKTSGAYNRSLCCPNAAGSDEDAVGMPGLCGLDPRSTAEVPPGNASCAHEAPAAGRLRVIMPDSAGTPELPGCGRWRWEESRSPKAAIISEQVTICANGPMKARYAAAPSSRPAGASQMMSSAI